MKYFARYGAQQLRHRRALLAQQLEDQQRRDRAGVGVVEVGEVVVAGDLAAERAALVAHAGLEERVADAVHQRAPAGRLDGVGDRPRGADVVEDLRARALLQDRLGEQRGEEVAGHELAGLVDEEAAVGVAVPGDAEVGALLADLADDELAVLRQQRVGLVVGELAVGLPVGRDELEPVEPLEDRADHRAGHAVAAVEHDLGGPHRARVDEPQRGVLELGVDVDVLGGPAAGRLGQPLREQRARSRRCPLSPDSATAPALDQLRARVGLRVVRGGAHQPAVELARADEVIEHLGADHPGVEHVRALGHQARPGSAPRAPARSAACRARGPPAARPWACRRGRRARARTPARRPPRRPRRSARRRARGRRRP